MTELLKEVNAFHRECNEELGKKLELIDKCLESGKECPCDIEDCSVDFAKIDKMNKMYDTILNEM